MADEETPQFKHVRNSLLSAILLHPRFERTADLLDVITQRVHQATIKEVFALAIDPSTRS